LVFWGSNYPKKAFVYALIEFDLIVLIQQAQSKNTIKIGAKIAKK